MFAVASVASFAGDATVGGDTRGGEVVHVVACCTTCDGEDDRMMGGDTRGGEVVHVVTWGGMARGGEEGVV